MSESDIDYIEAELRQTGTAGSRLKVWPPTGGHWGNAYTRLESLRTTAPPLDYAARAAALTPPAMTMKRTLPAATTYAEFQTAWAALQPGDVLPAKGVLFPGEAMFAKRLSSYAKVTLDAGCKFPGGKGLRLPAIWMKDVAYLQFVFDPATVITNPADGNGILFSGADHCVFDGFKVAHTAEDGMAGFPTVNHVQDCFFRGEVYDFCKVPSLDPHAEKGTGFHGFNTSDATVGGFLFRNNQTAVYVDNGGSPYGGSAVEHGNPNSAYAPSGNSFLVKARGLRMNAKTQVAANAVNVWGYIHDADFYVEADDLAGKAVSSDPYVANGFTHVTVTQGPIANVMQNPLLVGSPWDSVGGIVYQP